MPPQESGSSGPARPRIAFLGARGVPARYGGFETFVEELGARLVTRGVDVTVFCEAERGAPRPAVHDGMQLEYVRPWAPGPARTIQVDVDGLWRAALGRFDVVYLLGYGAAFAAWLPRLTGARVWINPDGIEWQRSKWGWPARVWLRAMESIACRAASRVVFDNGALEEHIAARMGALLPETSVLAYGARTLPERLDPAPLAELGLAPGAYDLLVCRFEPENHVAEIVEAHARAGTGRPLVAVAGTDDPGPYARSVLASAGDGTRFVGSIYDPAVLEPLRQHARLYLHGHSVGGTNPSLLEAMGAGNVVLAHDNAFNREVLGASDVYWRDVDELVERIRGWGGSGADERNALGRANLERVAQRYSWDVLADDYAALVRSDAARARARRAHPGTTGAAE
ncbi:MAG: DUF1972 domain-containing protein [Planctomycetota bacterium]